MNKTGSFPFIAYLAIVFFFIAIWALFLGGLLNTITSEYIIANNLTGIEAFLLGNINIVILFGLTLSVFAVIYFGGQG